MTDLERLDSVLKEWDDWQPMLSAESKEVLADAARAYRELLDKPVEPDYGHLCEVVIMTDFLSRLRDAIEFMGESWFDPEPHWSPSEKAIGTLAIAARCFSEGEPLQWCTTHGRRASSGSSVCQWATVSDCLQVSAGAIGTHQNSCRIVSQWRCPPPEGEG